MKFGIFIVSILSIAFLFAGCRHFPWESAQEGEPEPRVHIEFNKVEIHKK